MIWGLGIVKKFLQDMEGTIGVKSTLGQGSTFAIELPLAAAKPAPLVKPLEPKTVRDITGKLLLVDDEPEVRRIVKMFLKDHPLKIVEAENGDEAIECIRKQSFDFMLTDIKMPLMNGIQLIQYLELESLQENMQIHVITGIGDGKDSDEVQRLGSRISGVLKKPFSEGDLLRLLSSTEERKTA